MKRIAVIGAGMAGLSAARELSAAGVDVIVFEREPEVGGRLRTVTVDGVPIDVGAQFIAEFCTEVLAVVRAVGLDVALYPRPEQTSVAVDGVARLLGRRRDLLTGDLLSICSRLHLAGLALPLIAALPGLDPSRLCAAARFDRRSADEFVRRWAGDEAAEHFVDPLLRGLLYWDPETTSQAVLLVMLAAGARHGSGAFRIAGGMQRLPNALASVVDVRTSNTVWRVEPQGDRVELTTAAERMTVDGVVCATTASAAVRIVAGLSDFASEFMRSVSYSRTVVMTYQQGAQAGSLSGSLLYPTSAAPQLVSVNPADEGLVHVFLSGLGYDASAADILDAVRSAGVRTDWTKGAVHRHTWRWEEALPRFPVNSLRRRGLQRPDSLHYGRIAFAGDYLSAPHIEGALRSGRAAAQTILERLRS